ncbi:PH and SEC7 domain-containing protein 2 [Toxotes jaculatrix]|uniref:PH and SEC7 domain-containing protein 2 n=1 Tax=Toxotes jaculatrix TaxID=941984 RepID=UPI001B3AE3BA|nr:PH and SEC7 domain-containing protein 2 [Toxotes jaculatrix]XP_040915139.1 PH and SEC7 domain-containing protein 2 [Toxotes jaculatrix]XP_040915140.1 PH and SEC7 domain-containing protein 2 [Toxotes jaculatrix]
MEEEILCSSLPDISDSVLQQPQQDSWTSKDHQYINGGQEDIVWGETEVHINQAQGTDQVSLSSKAAEDAPEEAEQWEQTVWSVRPMTRTSAPLSFATVQWDMPDAFTEMPLLMTDRSSANELDSGDVINLETTSLSLHQSEDENAEPLIQEEGEEQDGFDSQLLNSNIEWTGNGSQPCDAADVQEPTTQEKEDSTHELLDCCNEIPLRTDSEEEDGHSVTSDCVETVDLIDTLEETEGSEDVANSLVDVKLEEEQEEPGVLLTGQGDSEELEPSANGAETEEENEEGGEEEEVQSVKNVSCAEESEEAKTVSCLSDVEVSAEQLHTDDAGLTLNPDKLIDLQQPELLEEHRDWGTEEDIETLKRLHEDPIAQTEEPEMCKDADHNVDPEQLEAVDNDKEASVQEAENAERIENSQEILELPEQLEETSCLEQQDSNRTTSQEREASPQPQHSESEQREMTEELQQTQAEVSDPIEEQLSEDHLGQSQHLEQSPQMELTEQSSQLENAEQTEESEHPVCVEAPDPKVAELQEQTEPTEQNEQSLQTNDSFQPTLSEQLVQPVNSDESEIKEQLSAETEVTQQKAEAELNQVGTQAEMVRQAEEEGGSEDGGVQTVVANGEQPKTSDTAVVHMNGGEVDREMARHLAEQLYKLDGIQRVDVVKHLDKDNDFSHAVGEEYLKFFDFTGQTLDHALRSFLKVVVLIGESQERERVLQHFACRFHQCNPSSFTSSGAVLALTCALMLLNTDLHGQHIGKSMSSSKFVSNLDGMNEGENFSKDLLKILYNSIKSEPLEWAVDEEELKNSVLPDEDVGDDAPLRSKANPFQDVPHDKKASVVKEGFLQRKLHADIDGKRTPWGKRGWKTFYGVLRGMVLYLQKDDHRRDQQTNEEVVSVHHSLAEQAADYTKKPHVFRLQTADWRVFLFQASSKVEMNSWISRINLVSALHSSPPFPAAVGSQRKFFRPILPASQSAHTLERQLQSHAGMLQSFKADLSYLHQHPPEGRKAKPKELDEHRVRAEYLHHEMCRYEIYIQVLEGWKKVEKTDNSGLSTADLTLFDKAMCADSVREEDEEDGGLKKSHSSPSLELEMAPPTVIKVRRNISERRTYRRTIVPRWNKEA